MYGERRGIGSEQGLQSRERRRCNGRRDVGDVDKMDVWRWLAWMWIEGEMVSMEKKSGGGRALT